MNLTDLARVISSIDEIETWKKETPQISTFYVNIHS